MGSAAVDYLRAVLLGIVQAVTEFLPISSSGHLVLAPHLLGEQTSSLTFDVGLHLGTLTAVVAYFWREWIEMAFAALRDVRTTGVRVTRWSPHGRLLAWLVLGTIPAAIVGVVFDSTIEAHAREAWLVGVMLIVFAGVIELADRWGGHVGRLLDMTPGRALGIGVAQAVALVPGVSRSGITIAAARGLGFDRPSSARFSFLLSAPVVFGAGLLKIGEALTGSESIAWGPMLAGAVTSAVVGALVIRGFLAYLQTRTLRVFVWYRIALGLVVLVAVATGAI